MFQNSEKIKNRFNNEACEFNSIYKENYGLQGFINRKFRKPIFERFNKSFEYSQPINDKSILDVGCGSGIYCVDFAKKGAKKVVGIDFSEKMIRIAKKLSKEEKVSNKCNFIVADIMNNQFKESFDIVLAMGVFDYVKDPVPLLCKMKDLSSNIIMASFPGHSIIREPLRKLRYNIFGKGDVFFYNKEDIEVSCKKAGLNNFDIIPSESDSGFFLLARKR